MAHYVLTLRCADRPGIVHAASAAIVAIGGNILENDQFTDPETGTFCMRTRFEAATDPAGAAARLADELAEYGPVIELRDESVVHRAVVMVSQFDHCLADLLYRRERGELPLEITAVVANHETCRPLAERYGIPFHHVPVTAATREAAEDALREVVAATGSDVVVLARYMQIL